MLGRSKGIVYVLLNEALVSCYRPVRTYGPWLPLEEPEAGDARRRPRLSAALAG
jgi:hypothetical protein